MYGKIFDSMYDGTLYGQWEAIVTFQQMIVLCDADGIVDITPQAISARTSIPLEIIKKGIGILEAPDAYSRTPDQDGRRIELIDAHRPWGWHIVNHEKYASMQDADTVRAQTRERVRKHREMKRLVTDGNGSKRYTDTDTDTDTNTDKNINTRPKRRRGTQTPLPDDFAISDRVRSWAKENKVHNLDAHFACFCAKAKAKDYRYADWDSALRNAILSDWANIGKGEPAGERI